MVLAEREQDMITTPVRTERRHQSSPDRFAIKSYRAGETIFTPTNGHNRLYIVRSGWVSISKSLPDGRLITLALLGPNSVFLQEDGGRRGHAGSLAETLVDASIVEAKLEAAGELLADSPQLAAAMISGLNRRITVLHGLVDQVLRRDTTLRLASTLLTLANAVGEPAGDGFVRLAVPLTHHTLANMLGSNRVTVTRKLRELQDQQLVGSAGRNSLLIHPVRLQAFVDAADQ
jgi:CRP/FNR family cyclic AMP-dependent transcriptional regulator